MSSSSIVVGDKNISPVLQIPVLRTGKCYKNERKNLSPLRSAQVFQLSILTTQAYSSSCAGAERTLHLQAYSILFSPSPLSRSEPVQTWHTTGNLTDVTATGASCQEVTVQITLSV